MTQDAYDHRLLGDRSNDPERATPAKGTCGHIQRKHAPQEPGPAPGRGTSQGLLPVHPLLARCRSDRVRNYTALFPSHWYTHTPRELVTRNYQQALARFWGQHSKKTSSLDLRDFPSAR